MRRIFVALCALIVAGCHVHPLPDDVTLNTYKIARRVECEAQDALKLVILDRLSEERKDRQLAELSDTIKRQQLPKLKWDELVQTLPKALKDQALLWEKVEIGLGFSFKITETNNNGGPLTVNVPLPLGSLAVALSASENKGREALREFEIVTTIRDLIRSDACAHRTQGERIRYPITGEVGLYETLSTFTDIWLDSGDRLVGGGRKTGNNKLNGFVDVLTFTTTISGSITPEVTIANSKTRTRVTSAKPSHASTRIDEHKLYVIIEPPKIKQKGVDGAATVLGVAKSGSSIVDRIRTLQTQESLRAIPR